MRPIGENTRRADSILQPADLASIDTQLRLPDVNALISRQVAPARTGDHPGTEVIVYKRLTREGAAKIFNFAGADNVPLVDQYTAPYTQVVRSIVIGFQITQQERRAAAMSGLDPVAGKTDTCKHYAAVKENSIFWSGSASHNIEGLLAYTGAQTYSVPNGVSVHPDWARKTTAEVLEDWRTAWGKVHLQDNYRATMAILNTKTSANLYRRLADADSTTIRKFMDEQGWFPAGILTTEAIPVGTMVILQNTRDVIEYALPMDLSPYDPFKVNGMTEEVDFEERYGGPILHRPLGVCIVTGIA